MNCPGCANEMTGMTMDSRLGPPVEFGVCTACQAFWFDLYKSPQLAPGSTLKLMKLISEHPPNGAVAPSQNLRCPRCGGRLLLTHDIQRATRFTYWRCEQEHGHFIGFLDFLREKDYIHPLSQQQISALRENIQIVNCSNCGAPIDLAVSSVCPHCGSPLSLLDLHQPQRMMSELQEAAKPRPVDPKLFLDLMQAKLDTEASFALLKSEPNWVNDVSSSGLVHAALAAVARWLAKLET
jgi:DNA-directed RNA polymerase subunit RPC12/RpoP